jgi:hypothetical protein
MKNATKRPTARKNAAKKAPARKKETPQAKRLRAGRARLEALANVEAESLSARAAVVMALIDISGGLVSVASSGSITPFGLFTLRFDDNQVGLGDGQMVLLYGKVSTAIGIDRVSALIQRHLSGQASAAVVIGDVCDLIQIWIDDPSIEA